MKRTEEGASTEKYDDISFLLNRFYFFCPDESVAGISPLPSVARRLLSSACKFSACGQGGEMHGCCLFGYAWLGDVTRAPAQHVQRAAIFVLAAAFLSGTKEMQITVKLVQAASHEACDMT